MSTALEIKNIEKRFGSRTVLNKISFETKTGEVFGLLGPNGAGKTTLIKMITGLLNIDDGEILINGKSLEHDFEAAMENIGAIVENPEFYKYMTGKQNILQYARLHKSVTIERVNEVIELVGLSNRSAACLSVRKARITGSPVRISRVTRFSLSTRFCRILNFGIATINNTATTITIRITPSTMTMTC